MIETALMTSDDEASAIADVLALEAEAEISSLEKLFRLANSQGDISGALDTSELAKIGIRVVEDYALDKRDRDEWETVVKEALESATQSTANKAKDYPWPGASNVKFPILTTAALQFNARAYPAIVKGDEAVAVKVVGKDAGRPAIGPDGQPVMQAVPGPDGQPMPQPVWIVPPGAKSRRAKRVADYLNTTIFYRMEDWESDTDALLIQLPIVGCVFRKLWTRDGMPYAATVSALRIIVPMGARSCDTAERLTEEQEDTACSVIAERQRSGFYRAVDLAWDAERPTPRMILEQHRLLDLDDDGVDEPYIVTVDYESQAVLRIEANFGPEDVLANDNGIVSIKRGKFYVKYDFFPHPEGKFYGIGLGHLLKQMGGVIDTAINQLIDAGHAQTAGGGFVASGVRLQARGSGSTLRMRPGEYRVVDGISGTDLRQAMVERTLPNVSPVTFQVLDLILGAARDISGVKDVITGEASNNGQVGTTLALIEQGLQVFNAVYKRVYRSLKSEFTLLFENIGKHGGEMAAKDYADVLDDPEADFATDFRASDMDIRPVSDPSEVTRMQKMAKAQFIMGTLESLQGVGGDARAAMKRVYASADIEDLDELFPAPQPQAPDPIVEAEAGAKQARGMLDMAKAEQTVAETEAMKVQRNIDAMIQGAEFGMAA